MGERGEVSTSPMNADLKNKLRRKRQAEGKRPHDPAFMPGDWAGDVPPAFAYTVPPTVSQRNWRDLPPAYGYNDLDELPTAHEFTGQSLDNSNPIDSDFYAAGNKIRPWAHNRVPAYLAVPEWETVAIDEFPDFGMKLAAMGHVVPQQVGGQQSIDVSPLIPEAEWTTYGAMNTLVPGDDIAEDGYLYA